MGGWNKKLEDRDFDSDDELKMVIKHGSSKFEKSLALVNLAELKGKWEEVKEHLPDTEENE